MVANDPEDYKLILMDWEIPEMDGLETVRNLRGRQLEENWPYIPVIAFTGNKEHGDEGLCLAAGMDDYLHKDIFLPKWRTALKDKLSGWLETKQDEAS